MNIAFDSAALLGPGSKNRGIGNYTDSQFRTLLRLDQENRYFFFNVIEEEKIFQGGEIKADFREDDFLCTKGGQFLDAPGFVNCYGQLIRNYIEKNQIDVFYITSPFDGILPMYKKEWMGNAAVVATVYDIIPYIMRKTYLPKEDSFRWYMERIEMLRWVDRILVISQSVKDDLVNYLHFDADRIDVIWGAPSAIFRKTAISWEAEERIRKKYAIRDPFIICTGGADDRKNIDGLIEAYARISPSLISQYQLVIVCKLQPAAVERFTRLAEDKGVAGRVILTNFVPNEELVSLCNLAALAAFPSKYEGLGLPVLEAWACGTGAVTSNNSSLGQIAGDAAITVDPYSVGSIADGLENALTGDLKLLAEKGEERLPLFTWERTAEGSMEAFRRAEEMRHRETGRNTKPIKQKIAFFSPLPPLDGRIPDYSVKIIQALAGCFDIDVYTDQELPPSVSFPANVTVYPYTKYKARAKRYRETVFQVGNSLLYTYMWPYIRRYGGLVVLHDYNLNETARAYAVGEHGSQKKYRALLAEDLSDLQCRRYMKTLSDSGASEPIPGETEINGFLTNYADKIIVHSDEYKRKLLKKSIARNVRTVCPCPETEADFQRAARQYEEYILETNSDAVTEELLASLRQTVSKRRLSRNETERLVHTLACAKNAEIIPS